MSLVLNIQDYSQYFEDENGCYIYPIKPIVLPDELELLHHYHDGPVIENYEENNYPADDSYNIDDFELPFKALDFITALKKGGPGIIEFLLTNPPSLY